MKDISPEQLNQLFSLLGALRDGVITVNEFSELNGILEKYPTAREYYLDYSDLCTDLSDLYASLQSYSHLSKNSAIPEGVPNLLNPPVTMDMLRVWAEYEKTAEVIEVPQTKQTEKAAKNVARKIPVHVPPRRVSKFSLISLAASVAAMLLMLTYVILNPRTELEVATLRDAVNAKWSHYQPLQKGSRLAVSASNPIQLHQGVVEVESDKGVIVTLEAPAAFRFISPDEIVMDYGRLFAAVPQSGTGFSVQTQNSKIIDLGTNFGVYADTRGETELHVFKGKTLVIAGQKGQDKKTVEVLAGQARRIDSYDSNVTDVVLNHNMFTQGIDSETGRLITGGKQVDLADIVGGGTGIGNGAQNKGLQWDGTALISTRDLLPQVDDFPPSYVPVVCNPLVDGIFVPYGKGEEPLVLTSGTETLNLDDFIASDTNGLLTLMLLRDSSNETSTYWFGSKEAAGGDPEKYPTLVFPKASAQGPVKVTTAYKNGADAYVGNDYLRSPRLTMGQWPILLCRYFENQRIHIVFLRFDISDIKGDVTGALLNLYMAFGNRERELQVYGLNDGPADAWDEATICYENAPGLETAELGNFALDDDQLTLLGTFAVVDNRIKTVPIQIDSAKSCHWTPPTTLCQSQGVICNAQDYMDEKGMRQPLMLDGISCGTRTNPSILMHANAGITFDLEAIRRVYGPVSIESFTAACGISEPALTAQNDAMPPTASFYVLVNGQEVFSAMDLSPKDPPQAIDIKLGRQARYLTLVATQGTDDAITNDWCLFTKPMLTLK